MNSPLSRNIYEQRSHNTRITAVFMLAFGVVLAFVGGGLDFLMNEEYGGGASVHAITIPFILLALGFSVFLFGLRTRRALGFAHAHHYPDDDDGFDWHILFFAVGSLIFVFGFVFLGTESFHAYMVPERLRSPYQLFLLNGARVTYSFPYATSAAVVLALCALWWSNRSAADVVIMVTNAGAASDVLPSDHELLNVVEEMSLAAGVPPPQVHVIEDDDPNAFAVGTSPARSHIVVTQGLLDTLNREELQAVVAHEMSHIRNYDVRLMTTVSILAGAVILISDWARQGMTWGGIARKSAVPRSFGVTGIVLFLLWVSTVVFAFLATRLMAMAVSRSREYLADASAAELTRNPSALISALRKIESATAPTVSINRGIEHLCIVDPLGKPINNREGFLAGLFGTHPPVARRIFFLQAMAYQLSSEADARRES